MLRVYECDLNKQKDLKAVLEADPYSAQSFARAGYKLRDGATLGEAKDKVFLYLSASDEFVKKADEKLKDIAKKLSGKDEERIIAKIKEEEETAESGFGSLFGD
jgi:hypothetical protein